MSLDIHQVRDRIAAAYEELLLRDRELLELDASERSLTHKLAEHLQREFPDWHVDCEYNRNGLIPKSLPEWRDARIRADDTDAKTVFPDLIVHKRGTNRNLVVVEAKKTSTHSFSDDVGKLKAYRYEYGYEHAFAIVFPVGASAKDASAAKDIFEVDA